MGKKTPAAATPPQAAPQLPRVAKPKGASKAPPPTPAPAPRAADEIDELWAKKRAEPALCDLQALFSQKAKAAAAAPAPPSTPDEDDFADSRGLKKKRRATTAEGYPIFLATELKVGQGGDGPDCPFDCDCCF